MSILHLTPRNSFIAYGIFLFKVFNQVFPLDKDSERCGLKGFKIGGRGLFSDLSVEAQR